MAASLTKEHSISETLNQSDENGGSISVAPDIPNCNTDDQPSSNSPPSDDATVSGEKRKREGAEDPDPHAKPNPNAANHPLWKTSLCSYFRRDSGSCSHGDACRYAHGEAELRIRPDDTWDPTSERAKKLRKEENGDGDESKGFEDERDEVMMTELIAGGDDDEEGDGGNVDLSKCIVHLPRKWSADHLRKFLEEQGIAHKSAKKKKGMVVGFVNFGDMEQMKSAVEVLQGKSVGSKMIKIADVIPRSFEKKVKQGLQFWENSHQSGESLPDRELNTNNCSNNDASLADPSGKVKSARNVATPLAHLPYADQLEHKKNSLVQMLKKLTRNARKACPNGVSLPDWILKSREIGGLPCTLEGIVESPVINGYRNKCEFSVGYSVQGKPTVGFMLGNFREGVTAVEEPVDCPNVSGIACKYASIFQEFLQSSGLPIWNRFKNTGFWRQLTVREGRKPSKAVDVETCETGTDIAEVMIIVQVSLTGFDDAIVTCEFERMANAIAEGATASSPPLPLTALVIQDHQGISNVAPADAQLRCLPIPRSDSTLRVIDSKGEPRIHDYISNLQFSISPTAFFQVNTLAAEKLYSLAGEWAGLGPDTLLFDVCCGTGTIGLTLAHHVGMVIGIEMNASAVVDAHRNAEINGITNCKFVCAKAEDVMGSLLKEYLQMVPKKENESVDSCQCSSTKIISAKKNGNIMDEMHNTKNISNHNLENNQSESNIGGEESGSQDQESCTVEARKSPKRLFKNVVAIVDPPRGGLHPTVIKVLRTHSRLRKLVYISCNPESLVANAIELCTPSPENSDKGKKDNRGWRNMSSAGLARHRVKSMPNSEPFCPVKAMAVDLFPHTPHCEMVMLLER